MGPQGLGKRLRGQRAGAQAQLLQQGSGLFEFRVGPTCPLGLLWGCRFPLWGDHLLCRPPGGD